MSIKHDINKIFAAIREGDFHRIAAGARQRLEMFYYVTAARRAVNKIESADGELSRRVAEACRTWVNDSFSEDGHEIFRKIKSRKSTLNDDDTEVTYSFHGPSDEGLTDSTYEGTSNTVKISDFPHAPDKDGRLLTALAREFSSSDVLELGTCLGTSAAYLGTGLEDGHLVTVEAGEPQVEIARETIAELGLDDRVTVRHDRFQDVLFRSNDTPSFQLAFLDGHHQKDATLQYFDVLAENAQRNAVLIFDDVNGYSEGMTEAWNAIREDARTDMSILAERYGIALVNSDIDETRHIELPY